MTKNRTKAYANQQLLLEVTNLLEDPRHADNPLLKPLAGMFAICRTQQEKLDRLITISDGYHELIRINNIDLNEAHNKQAKRLKKLARISDFYQNNLHKLTSEMEQAALTDILTGLYNRRYLIMQLKKYVEQAIRKSSSFSIAILDIDYFKLINDKYSHETGDEALKAIAKTMLASIRETDLCGRWGGEEFLIIFPETELELATQVTRRLLDQIALIKIPNMGSTPLPHVTASVGLSLYHLDEEYSEAIDRADTALYKAKVNGKNTIMTAA